MKQIMFCIACLLVACGDSSSPASSEEENNYNEEVSIHTSSSAVDQEIQSAKKFRVKFFSNIDSASGVMRDQIFFSKVPQYLNPNTFSRNRCSFQGWALSPEGSVVYKDKEAVTVSSNVNLYAIWYCKEANKCIEGSLTDSRDGQMYKTITFSGHSWMSENLRYKPQSPGYDWSWCYEELESNCKYGRYYTFAAALDSINTGCGYQGMCDLYPNSDCDAGLGCNERDKFDDVKVQGICPKGWHIPTRWDFMDLSIIKEYQDTCSFFSNMIGSSSGLEYYASFNNLLSDNTVYFYDWESELVLWTTSNYKKNDRYGRVVHVRNVMWSPYGTIVGNASAETGYPIRCVMD